MAGYGHASVTGIDERTLGRIDLLLFDADYGTPADAVDDTWRIAVLAADARRRAARERVRAHAVRTANAQRDPAARRAADASAWHRACLAAALVLAVVAVGLVMPTPSSGGGATSTGGGALDLNHVMLPAGLAAVIALATLWWLEPRRANGSLWGSRAPAVLHLACAAMWLLGAAVAVVGRWREIDAQAPLPATTGLVLLVVSSALAALLWHSALHADRAGRQSGLARTTGDLLDPRDGIAVFFALDQWWRDVGPAAMATDGARVRRVRREVLARLRLAGSITRIDEQFAALDEPPVRWRERRR